MLEKQDLSPLSALSGKYGDLPLRDPGSHWYDDIKLKESISYKGKKGVSQPFDDLAQEYIKKNKDKVLHKAQKVHDDRLTKHDKFLYRTCCDFLKLEEKYKDYIVPQPADLQLSLNENK